MKTIIVVGGGAAGMIAAYKASFNADRVILMERNEKLGKKIYITGKGRCNVTNAVDTTDFFDSVFVGKKFAYSSVYSFDAFAMIELLNNAGLKTVVERGDRVFPESNKASDVTKTLQKLLNQRRVEIMLNTKVVEVLTENQKVVGVKLETKETFEASSVILCCGGKSYPSTGSDGNGFRLSQKLGHTIIEPKPALVAMLSNNRWTHRLAGLSLKNVEVSMYANNKKIHSELGEMLFTHKGVSGPIVLTASCFYDESKENHIIIDLKPGLNKEKLEKRIIRDFDEQQGKMFKNSLNMLLPQSLAEEIVLLSKINPEKKVSQITPSERGIIADLLKNLKININGIAGFEEAIISSGGVDTKQINPSTMESKLVDGLYLAGEMINMHAFTGGFNLQLAFSTGSLAGENV